MRSFLAFIAVLTRISGILYLTICFRNRTSIQSESKMNASGLHRYAVLERDQHLIALRADEPFRLLIGLFYATAFYWGALVYLWRYGFWRTLAILVLPVTADVAIVGAIGVSDGGALILGAIFLIPVRAVGGFLIGQSDAKVVLLRHQKKGWALKTIVRSRSPWEAVKLSARAN